MTNKRVYFFIISFLLLLLIMINWSLHIKNNKMPRFDQWSRPFVDIVADTNVYTIFRWITEFGSFHIVLPLTLGFIIILRLMFKTYLPALIYGSAVLFAYLVNQILKQFIARERPSISALLNAEGYSFPSGHSMISIVCYGLLAYFIGIKINSFKRKLLMQLMFGSLVFLIGFSRYILNVHYLTDIISGFIFGSAILLLAIYLYQFLRRYYVNKGQY